MDAIKQNQIEPEKSERHRCMRLLAQATVEEMRAALQSVQPAPEVFAVRGPETGLVMVRGRIGGGGDPFNLGEATVTRATVRLGTGEIGHGQMLGTEKEKARLAAVFDALWQRPEQRGVVEALVLAVEERIAAQDRLEAEQTAATRVDFFTMVRGEN
ncbi:phosphonate C-P lyase system protein PhnG [Pararhizobium antarcticum]|uniref:Phosphonate C-P lyase system protein PhnG n=1 Tax=Pararhizobium antarcticum TaxID=1798805 RepID=A0A657LNE1_9HYPH|nr:phosphonate C-P lyase system protein PhnG [Pararhizobium antarcticum]OJF91318.1 phosphonate C-P lyase system protein PhnG [Pararhizobium antarcticum]OJG01225.1 phosphonate C-P lyase system protein PhnG [Rhizobium sp. 58]